MVTDEAQNIIEQPETNHVEETQKHETFLALLPLKNVVVLPKSIVPIIVGRETSIRAVEFALKNNKSIFITAQKDEHVETPTSLDLFSHGTRSKILQVMRMSNGALKILAEGVCRSKIIDTQEAEGFLGVHCIDIESSKAKQTVELEALWRQVRTLYLTYAKYNEKAPTDLIALVKSSYDMDQITDTLAIHISNLSVKERQTILETVDLEKRMLILCGLLKKEIDILQTEQRIRGHVQTQVEKSQREYYLTEQMKAIQKELGREDQSNELDKIRKKIKTLGLPQEAREKIEKELKRLDQMPPLSSEAVVSRHYVDWVISLPWTTVSNDTISLGKAEKILNAHHSGLKKAKERILEFLAAKKFAKDNKRSPIICLVGPPGVGKTSIAKSISESMGREFVRISLGGVRDEAEIRGHRRTYIGALPGKIIQAMKKAKTLNPVILLDEIDKMSADMHGDPSSALLEVLDPEQNTTFIDHFLDIEYDLSQVMFVTTANMIDDIPYPLFDRMEVISLSGYTENEKIAIAKKFLVPKNLKLHGLNTQQFKIPENQLHTIVNQYTKEAGVRQLERIISKLMRKAIQVFLRDKSAKVITVTSNRIAQWLGNPKFKKTSLNQEKNYGLATGLAWTELGGDVLEIETTTLSGKGGLTLTGQLGDVMQESAQAALSYIRSRATDLGLKGSFHSSKDIHIHMPEGATPKDGPSAGITICSALVSALIKKPLPKDLAMTGEITLQGRVLSVGGLKAKLLAAKQHDIKTVIVPKENYDDIQEISKEVDLNPLNITYANTMDDVLKFSFGSAIFKKHMKKKKKLIKKAVSQ
ncbi:endopeptidase La [Candidatus Dependentiae bacterium]|nr:endopeptidase La [Candidatus Dependentiae bacterium]